MAYIVSLLGETQRNSLLKKLSNKRQKGKAPSREHSSHGSPVPKKRKISAEEEYVADPTFVIPPTRGRGSSRGRGRGGRRGRGSKTLSGSVQLLTGESLFEEDTRGKHWRPNELHALITGANHLRPILKGKFKSSADGVTIKTLAWEELSEYVMSIGKTKRSVDQCRDKLLYFTQDAKKKVLY